MGSTPVKGREGRTSELGGGAGPGANPTGSSRPVAVPHWGFHTRIRHGMETVPSGAVTLGEVAVS